MKRLLGDIRRADEDFHMIARGDRVAVGVSGGKDSLVLLRALAVYSRFAVKPFEVVAITLKTGDPFDVAPIRALCEELNVPYVVEECDLIHQLFDVRREENPCALCARLRRGALLRMAAEQGCSKLALGHHYDDAVETFLMSLLFEGRISCFQPVTHLDRTGIDQIRPMLYLHEKTIDHFAQRENLPILTNRCPVDKITKRAEVKDLLYRLSGEYPEVKERIFGAMQRLPLPEWEPKHHTRRKNID